MSRIPKRYKHRTVEAHWREKWEEWGIYRYDPTRGRDETFVVDTPPPTVSGSLHVGHVFSYTHQDLLVRFQRMKGKNIFFPMGWDDNGLPTERRVQNVFNVRCDPNLPYVEGFVPRKKKKSRPEVISRRNFIELCQELTEQDEQAYKELWQAMGQSVDWSEEYATISAHSRALSQYSFLDLLTKGHVYQTERPTMWDVDFQTAVAQAEVDNRSRPGAYHHIRFQVEGSDESFVIATTRPELLPACVAVMAHPEDERYQHLFGKTALTPLFSAPVPILPTTVAEKDKGTGILMVCTFGDQTDIEWWREFKLPLRQIIGWSGRLEAVQYGEGAFESRSPQRANAHYGELAGLPVKRARSRIVELLGEGENPPLTRPPEPIEHDVKFYEKGDRPLEFITTRQWFVRLLDKKEALLEKGAEVQWHPGFMRTRYDHWVEGLNQDWCISRQRYFGVPIPVWYRLDAEGAVCWDEPIVPTTEQLPVDPLADCPAGYSAEQRGQPGGFIGDPDVFDTWATSSLTPQIGTRWYKEPQRHQNLFPMDIRPQSHEIIRTWAFYTIAKAALHQDCVPWHHVVISGWILDPDRKKMSKSKGNVVTPMHLIERYSADAVRYWAGSARLGVDTAYDEKVFNNGKRLVNKVFNASRFVLGRLEELDPALLTADRIDQPLDLAVLAELKAVVARASTAFEEFRYALATQAAEEFFWAFCDHYLELVKIRAYDEDAPGRSSALATLKLALSVLLRLFAPALPHVTEEVWSWVFADSEQQRSVHTAAWPGEDDFAAVGAAAHPTGYRLAISVISEVRRAKTESQRSMKWPVTLLRVTAPAADLPALEAVQSDIAAAANASQVEFVEGAEFAVATTLGEPS